MRFERMADTSCADDRYINVLRGCEYVLHGWQIRLARKTGTSCAVDSTSCAYVKALTHRRLRQATVYMTRYLVKHLRIP